MLHGNYFGLTLPKVLWCSLYYHPHYWQGNRLTRMKNFAPNHTAIKCCGSHHFTLEPLSLTPMLFSLAWHFPVSPGVYKGILWSADRDSISYANSIGILAEVLGYHVERPCGHGWLNRKRAMSDYWCLLWMWEGRVVVFVPHIWYLGTRWSYLRSSQESVTYVPMFSTPPLPWTALILGQDPFAELCTSKRIED